eukprot:TRINITY_DN106178_c0_g1_i1.p1 TRINITY_DN106178_c0_g1~~TRINITY_DN106178_c0_g1_i1.p1  ORF type:complete len:779 (-),score=109.52 TRINITY_DN106178_c0_g1_i1:75-2411(-)
MAPSKLATRMSAGIARFLLLGMPSSLAALNLGVEDGILDVTQVPFSVDNSGKSDITVALQAAVDFAQNHSLVAYFPTGTYLVSDTIKCFEKFYWHTEDNNTWPSRFTPYVLIGQHAASGRRPRIVLKEASEGYGDPANPKNVVHFTAVSYDPNDTQARMGKSQTNVNFNQLFRGIDIEVLKGNPGAVGIFHQAAQGSSVQDCTMYMGEGHTGLAGAAGSGGSHVGVTVIGGQVGLDLSNSQPAPTVTGMTLINQTTHAIVYDGGKEALSGVGIRIVMSSQSRVAVKSAGHGKGYWGNLNQMAFIDTSIDCSASTNATAFQTSASLYLQNVFMLGCETAVSSPSLQYAAPNPHSKGNWVVINDLAAGVDIESSTDCDKWVMDVWADSERQSSPFVINASSSVSPKEVPDLVAAHLWDELSFPSFDHPTADMVSVKDAPFGAKGDGITDDYEAIQRAVDSAEVVLLPKGHFRLSKTLVLRPSTKLIGVARTFSVLMPMSNGLGSDTPQPLILIPESDGHTIIAYLTGALWETLSNVYAVQWNNHNHLSTWRQNYFYRTTECLYGFPHPQAEPSRTPTMPCGAAATMEHPLLVVTGSGQFYNCENEDFLYEAPSYRHMLVTGNRPDDRVEFYQANFEHASSDANMQVLNAYNVHLYSFKTENDIYGGHTQRALGLMVTHSSNIRVYGHGGNAMASTDSSHALYLLENATDIRIVNVVPQHEWEHDPSSNNSVIFDKTNKGGVRTSECSRPVLYLVTSPMTRNCDMSFSPDDCSNLSSVVLI